MNGEGALFGGVGVGGIVIVERAFGCFGGFRVGRLVLLVVGGMVHVFFWGDGVGGTGVQWTSF